MKKIFQVAVVCLFGVVMFCNFKFNIKEGDKVQLELGEGYKQLLDKIESDNIQCQIDFSKIGKYEFTYRKQWNQYKGELTVADTKAPEVSIKSPIIVQNDTVSIRDFVIFTKDYSSVKIFFSDIEKIDENISRDNFLKLETTYCETFEPTKSTETNLLLEEGLYKVKIQVIDVYGNATEATTYIYRDIIGPDFPAEHTITASIKDNQTVSINMDDIITTDAFCGPIAKDNITITDTSNFPHIIIKASDDYGNYTEAEYTVVLQ